MRFIGAGPSRIIYPAFTKKLLHELKTKVYKRPCNEIHAQHAGPQDLIFE